jgi:hypothetical protein
MDEQSKMIFENLYQNYGQNNTSRDLIGGYWTENSPYYPIKNLPIVSIGRWGEMMFEKSFGLKSKSRGIDLPSECADIKTFTRAYERNKFSGSGSVNNDPKWYFVYCIFPDEYRLYRIPSDDNCIKPSNPENGLTPRGQIDITGNDLIRFDNLGYDSFLVGDNNTVQNRRNDDLEKFFS